MKLANNHVNRLLAISYSQAQRSSPLGTVQRSWNKQELPESLPPDAFPGIN